MGKRAWIALLCVALAGLLGGCSDAKQALGNLNAKMQQSQLDTPTGTGEGVDWSFVPEVREQAQTLFMQAAPDAKITETSVALRSLDTSRVIVVIDYMRGGISGKYGFDYALDEQGNYTLKRYGEGVSTSDF